MNKLLLVTNDQAVRDAFAAVSWDDLGFRQPRVAASVEDALISLKAFHADAIAIALPKAEDERLFSRLLTEHPDLPVMAAPAHSGEVENYARELGNLLLRMNADVSDDGFTLSDQLMVCRHEFFRALMDRRIDTRANVERLLRLVRSKMDCHKPCVVVELAQRKGSDSLKGRWQYGTERMELALRNIFGVEVRGLRILSCVLPGDRIWLLGCPMRDHEQEAEGVSMTGIVTNHVQDCIEHVNEYLDLDLNISSIQVLPALTAMAAKRD